MEPASALSASLPGAQPGCEGLVSGSQVCAVSPPPLGSGWQEGEARGNPGVFLGVVGWATVLVAEMLLTLTRVRAQSFFKLQDTMFSMVIGITGKRKSSSITYRKHRLSHVLIFHIFLGLFY